MRDKNFLKIIYGKKSQHSHDNLYVREEDFEFPHGEDYKIAIKELEKIQNSSINGKTFLELFSYDGISLWWFIYQSFIPHYKKTTNFVRKFLDLVEKTNPSHIEISDDFKNLDLIRQICERKKIKLSYSKSSYLKFTIKQKSKNSIKKSRFEKITKEKNDNRINLFKEKSSIIPNLKDKFAFIIPTIYRRRIFDPLTCKTKEGEYIQEPIMNLLGSKNIVGIDLDYTFKGSDNILSNRLDEDIPWLPIEILLQQKSSEHDNFLKKFESILNMKKFQQLFSYEGISLWNSVKEPLYEMQFSPHMPLYLRIIDSIYNHFHKEKPKAVFLPYETGPYALAIIAACQKLNVTTIGIQHGYIYENNPMYSFGNYLKSTENFRFLLPSYLLLFGHFVKELLIQNGYPPSQLIEFGNPAFFGIEKIRKNFDKNTISEKFGIKPNQKIILFTSGKLQKFYSSHGKYDYDEQIWNQLIKEFGKNNDFFLILKPHPQEQNTTVYQTIMNENNPSNAMITHESIYELILLSDVIISVFSSTMLDSLCFHKPVIRVKFGSEKHQIFDNTNAVVTSNLNNLSDYIKKITNDEIFVKHLMSNVTEFIKDQYGIPETNPQELLYAILEKNNK